MTEVQLVIFKLNNELCGTTISQVNEIIRYQEVSKVPELPDFIEGIVSLRGKVVPVVDLNKKFNLGQKDVDKKTKIIVTEIKDKYIGFKVNDVIEVKRISDQNIESSVKLMKSMGAKEYVTGVAKNDEQLIALIDLHKILDEQEMERIKKHD